MIGHSPQGACQEVEVWSIAYVEAQWRGFEGLVLHKGLDTDRVMKRLQQPGKSCRALSGVVLCVSGGTPMSTTYEGYIDKNASCPSLW